MRNLLALGALLAFMPVAHAADKGGEFTHNAEYRVRYQMDGGGWKTGSKDADTGNNTFSHRFKLDTNFKASEKFSAHLTLLHNAIWGDSTRGDSAVATPDNAADLEVNQAYGTWMINDAWSLKFGRGGFTLADGSVISQNDWEKTPYAFEGALLNYEHEMFRLNLFGVKAEDKLTTVTGNDDPETNFFGVAADWKSLPEFLKMVNLHVLKVNADQRTVGPVDAGQDQMRYGLVVAGDMAHFDYKLDYAAHSGKQKTTATADTDLAGSMMAVQVGYSMPEMMKSHITLAYHSDTGNKASTTDKNEGYNSFFTEKHNSAGMMDVLGWGNLTFMKAGVSLSPMDQVDVALAYWKFSRSEDSAAVTFGNNGYGAYTATGDSKDIGSEIDLSATKKYDGGFAITAWYGIFSPGKHLKDSFASAKDDAYHQLFVEGKMTF